MIAYHYVASLVIRVAFTFLLFQRIRLWYGRLNRGEYRVVHSLHPVNGFANAFRG